MQIGHNSMWWTLKRYVINNRAIKFSNATKNEWHFALVASGARRVPLRRWTMHFTDFADSLFADSHLFPQYWITWKDIHSCFILSRYEGTDIENCCVAYYVPILYGFRFFVFCVDITFDEK